MRSTDYPDVRRIASELPGVGMHPYEDQGWHDRFVGRNPTLCLAADIAGRVVGFVYCGEDGRRATVYHMSVDVAHQGRGIGSLLLTTLEPRIRERGIRRAMLNVKVTNPGAIAFYTRHGWWVRDDLQAMSKDL